MDIFTDYLVSITDISHRARLEEIFTWIFSKFPDLMPKIAWNQPMFTDHDTFIIGFSVAKNHISVAPEHVAISYFTDEIQKSGYEHTKELFRIKWKQTVDFSLLEKIIEYNMKEKKDCTTFWR